MVKKLGWEFIAWDYETDGKLVGGINISVVGQKDEKEANKAVRKIVQRKFYKLQKVYEVATSHDELHSKSMAQQKELVTKLLKKLK